MDDDVVFFAMVQRYNIYFKYVSLHHDILGSHGAKSSTENIYWAKISKYKFEYLCLLYFLIVHAKGMDFMYAPEIMIMTMTYYLYLQSRQIIQK